MLLQNIDTSESELPPNAFTPEFPALSRRLAYLLRHSKLPDKHGWVSVDALCKEYGCEEHIIRALVFFDDKGRFIFSDDKTKVRALYGHSIKIESDAIPMPPSNVLYYGIVENSLPLIFKEGIKPMSRAKVHLSPTYGMAYFVGGRHARSTRNQQCSNGSRWICFLQNHQRCLANRLHTRKIYKGDS